jgi:hypothetical protein
MDGRFDVSGELGYAVCVASCWVLTYLSSCPAKPSGARCFCCLLLLLLATTCVGLVRSLLLLATTCVGLVLSLLLLATTCVGLVRSLLLLATHMC